MCILIELESQGTNMMIKKKKKKVTGIGRWRMNLIISECTLPIKADEPPNLDIPTATLAGAPPGAFLNAGASASDTPPTVGTKSINISPKHTTRELFSWVPPRLSLARALGIPA